MLENPTFDFEIELLTSHKLGYLCAVFGRSIFGLVGDIGEKIESGEVVKNES